MASIAALACSAPCKGASALSWTDWADLSLAGEVVLVGAVENIDRLSRRDAPDVPDDEVRALIRVKLHSVLKAGSVLPERAAWLWQGPRNAKGSPDFGSGDVLISFSRTLSGGARPDVQPLSLVSAAAQQPWTASADATVRGILKEAVKPGAAGLMVTGVADGFRSDGDIPGTGESQFFLSTQGGRTVTLVVSHAPGRKAEVLANAGDIVDRAQPIEAETLLWRGLACGLPEKLPAALALHEDLAADYRLALASIGPCGRTVPPPG